MLISLYKKFVYKLNCRIQEVKRRHYRKTLRKDILNYYLANPTADEEINNALIYLKNHNIENPLIPTSCVLNFNQKVTCSHDSVLNIPYVVHQRKKLYFPQKETNKALKRHYLALQEEQSDKSPHRYVTPEFSVATGDVLYDIGSAEGVFVLDNIEKVRHAVLFEANEQWLNVLQATFAPWKDKVTIVPKYVSDTNDDKNITIDMFIKEYGEHLAPDFVKIDVEGAEMKVLEGMRETIANKSFKMAITTYHYYDDHSKISAFLTEKGFTQESSKGVTLVGLDEHRAPYFKKALIRASL